MPVRLFGIVVLLLAASAPSIAQSVASDRRFKVICHFKGEREAAEALRAAQKAWPYAAEFYGVERGAVPPERMEIHLYRTMADYAREEARLTGGRFRQSGAFSAYATKSAHVAVQPHCTDETLRRFGLPLLTRLQITHEACHVISYHFSKTFAQQPLWFSEGFATWAASRAWIEDAENSPGLELDPYSSRMLEDLHRMRRGGKLPGTEAILNGQLTFSYLERYSVWWMFYRSLVEGPRRKRFLALAKRVNTTGAPDITQFLRKTVPQFAGGTQALDEALRDELTRLRPAWQERYRSMEWIGDGWLQRAFLTAPAVVWRLAEPESADYAIEGSVTLLPGGNPTARLLLASGEKAYLSLDFSAGWGVRLVRHVLRGHTRTLLAEKRTSACRIGAPLRFRVEVSADRLLLRLNGRRVLDTSLGGHPTRGKWGLGVDPAAAAIWRLARTPGPELAPRGGVTESGESPASLLARIRKAPGGPGAVPAVHRLGRAGPDSFVKLGTLIARYARTHPEIARAAALALGAGDEPGRFRLLRQRYHPSLTPSVRGAVVAALARRYPEYAELVHESLLDPDATDKPAIFVAAVDRGLPVEVVRGCLAVRPVASLAYHELLERGEPMKVAELAVVAREEAPRGFFLDYAHDFQARLRTGRGWPLLESIALLVGDERRRVREGALTLLMTVSGKDMIADVDVWRSWIAARRDRYAVPDDVSPGRVAAAVLRGVAYLRRRIDTQGYCSVDPERAGGANDADSVGATGLAVLALRAAGVNRDDPVFQRALDGGLLERNLNNQLVVNRYAARNNYAASILTMALGAIDPERFRPRIQSLANRIAGGQLPSGQWSYQTGDEYGKTPAYIDSRRFVGDASNTQYALLGLRAARRAGADVRPVVWQRSLTMYLEGQDPWGGWGYSHLPFSGGERSMTSAALAGIAICMEGLHGKEAARLIAESGAVRRGLVRQGQLLIGWKYAGFENYAFYGVERACVLTGTRLFNDYDWYREGALDLLGRQRADGSWHGKSPGRGPGSFEYGPDIDTAYALLFLKRATTLVDGTRTDGVVRCPPGPKRIRDYWPWRWPQPRPDNDKE